MAGDFEHTTTSAFIAYNFWTAAKKQWPAWPNERIKSSIQDSIQKSLLKFVKVSEISLLKIEFKIVKVVQIVKIASLKIGEKQYYIQP